jgi:phage terminase large subunit-like protein
MSCGLLHRWADPAANCLDCGAATDGADAVLFLEGSCYQSKGEWAGKRLVLMAWQKQLLNDLLVINPDTGLRQYRTAYIQMPRKNGKSTLLAGLGIFFQIADGERGAEVYAVAGDRQQARIIHTESKRMIEANPELRARLTPRVSVIEGPDSSVFRVLSADAKLQQGLNPSAVLFDEVAVQPDEDLWSAMTLGSGVRRQPLVIGITTPGSDQQTLAGRLYEKGKRIESGEVEDPTFFFRCWEPPDGANHHDPATWTAANPALAEGGFLKLADFEARVWDTPESDFRRFRCGQWVESVMAWLPVGALEACIDKSVVLNPKLPLVVGLDIGLVNDASACAMTQMLPDGRVVVELATWRNPYSWDNPLHADWRTDLAGIREDLLALRKVFPKPAVKIDGRTMAGPAYCFDPHSFTESAQMLAEAGLAMIEVDQTNATVVPMSRVLFDLIMQRRIVWDGDPILAEHFRNVLAIPRGAGWWITKEKGSRKHIDGVRALLNALTQVMEPAPPERVGAFLAG